MSVHLTEFSYHPCWFLWCLLGGKTTSRPRNRKVLKILHIPRWTKQSPLRYWERVLNCFSNSMFFDYYLQFSEFCVLSLSLLLWLHQTSYLTKWLLPNFLLPSFLSWLKNVLLMKKACKILEVFIYCLIKTYIYVYPIYNSNYQINTENSSETSQHSQQKSHQYQQHWCQNRCSEYRCNVIIGILKALCRL